MRIITPAEVAKQAGNKYLGVLVAAKFARYLNEFPKDQLATAGEKLTTKSMQALVRRIPVSRGLIRSAVQLARMTRPLEPDAPAYMKEYVDWGAGPRASQYLVLGAKARAAIAGRPMADLDDVRSVAQAVLRHRVVPNFAAEAAERSSESLVSELLQGKDWLK